MNKEKTQNIIKDIIEKVGFEVVEVSLQEKESKDGSSSTWFSITLNDPYLFLHNNAGGLLALNHLVKRITEEPFIKKEENEEEENKVPQKREEIVIDINGHQKKRIENLHAIAHMMAERARFFKANMEVDPMSAFERRVIHEFLSDATDLKTESEGYGPNRRVVIKYIGKI
jgi:predicted RNA-binding protein Jag